MSITQRMIPVRPLPNPTRSAALGRLSCDDALGISSSEHAVAAMLRRLTILGILALLLALGGCGEPFWLTRWSAKAAIEQSVEFKHRTKFYFEVGERALFDWPAGTDQLRQQGLLVLENQHTCEGEKDPRQSPRGCIDVVTTTTAKTLFAKWESAGTLRRNGDFYEMAIGNPEVTVTGILKDGVHATVEFTWSQGNPNTEVGINLQRLPHFWDALEGKAHMVKYDSGWRISDIELDKAWIFAPPYAASDFKW
jgi:hypothetical protein